MRDIVLTIIVFGTLPFILWRPWYGIIVWVWLGFMNPHRLTYGFAYDLPFAFIVAITTLVGFLASREEKRIPWTRETITLVVFVAWMGLTTIFAVYPEFALKEWNKVWKIQLMIFVALMLMRKPERIHALVWTIALSLGFYGVKGGIFTILTGGAYRVQGPAGTFIGGNNETGLALIMTIPLIWYLYLTSRRALVQFGLIAAMALCSLAAVGTQSRGALLGIVAMAAFLWLKSRKKFVTAFFVVVAALPILMVMPQQWYDRIGTIETYQQDQSAQGRINAWWMAFNLAKDRPLGGGFETFQREMFARYAPDPGDYRDVHSIYFEVLGEHGFVGLALFLTLALMTWFSASWIARHAKSDPGTAWIADLARMIQVSLIGYATAGAFLGLAYFDFFYTLVAIVILCKALLATQLVARETNEPESRRTAAELAATSAEPVGLDASPFEAESAKLPRSQSSRA